MPTTAGPTWAIRVLQYEMERAESRAKDPKENGAPAFRKIAAALRIAIRKLSIEAEDEILRLQERISLMESEHKQTVKKREAQAVEIRRLLARISQLYEAMNTAGVPVPPYLSQDKEKQ